MNNIVKFPSSAEQAWKELSAQISKNLTSSGYSGSFLDRVLERMRLAFDEFQFNYAINVDNMTESQSHIIEQIQAFEQALKAHNTQLIVSRLNLEIRLAVAEGYK